MAYCSKGRIIRINNMEKLKRILNWINWNIGGLRDPECFFETGDPIENAAIVNMLD